MEQKEEVKSEHPTKSEQPIFRVPERMIIFIDARNIKSSQDTYNRINRSNFILGYKEVMDFFSKKFHIIRGYFYDGAAHISQQTLERKKFYNFLRGLGITMRLKELDQNHPTQKGVDIYLSSDMISLAYENAYDIAVIMSGDGDYKALIELVKSKGKKVWVMAFHDALSASLRECADKILLIDKMTTILKYTPKQKPIFQTTISNHPLTKGTPTTLPVKKEKYINNEGKTNHV